MTRGCAGSGESGFATTERGQAEITGSVLLIGVISVVVVVMGGLLLAGYVDDATSTRPPVDLNASVNQTHVTLLHLGGNSLATDEVTVILRQDGARIETALADWSLSRDDGDVRLEPAERAAWAHGLAAGPVEVVVVHRPSESVLFEETRQV